MEMITNLLPKTTLFSSSPMQTLYSMSETPASAGSIMVDFVLWVFFNSVNVSSEEREFWFQEIDSGLKIYIFCPVLHSKMGQSKKLINEEYLPQMYRK